MKKVFLITIMILGIIGFVNAAGITGSAHDFSGDTWNGSGEICIVCHTPHDADMTVTDTPLWNHEVTTATFSLYSGTSLNATTGQPAGDSKLCLSCHDGTVAYDSFGGATGVSSVTAGALIGTDLTNDHPVSFTYDDALASTDGGLNTPSSATSGLGSTIEVDMLSGGQMECSSCHDVHDNTNGSFLIMGNASSALCLTCHNK